jgi:methionine salvage enolase-phosphatase E1
MITGKLTGFWGTIGSWVVSFVLQKVWNYFSDAYADWKMRKEKEALEKAIEALKKAKTLEEQERATRELADNSF